MTQRVKINLFITVFTFYLLYQFQAFADIYQWTDSEGTTHFSDSPVNAPKGKSTIIHQEVTATPTAKDGVTGSKDSIKAGKKLSKTKVIDDENKSTKKPSPINFNPGNYEVKNWMEIPGKGRVKQEKDTHCLTENDIGWKMYRESGCELLSETSNGDTLSWEFKCGYNGMNGASGSITYAGDTFDGTLIYHGDKGGCLKIGLSGKRIGNCTERRW